jgi:hypothetical protein
MTQNSVKFTSFNYRNNLSDDRNKVKLPLLVWVVFFFSILAIGVNGVLFGFNITGISWVIPLVFSVYIIANRIDKVTFPWLFWLPWIVLLIVNLLLLNYDLLDYRVSPLQRTIQLLTPLLVGIAISTYRPTQAVVSEFIKKLQLFAYILLVVVAYTAITNFNMLAGFAAANMMVLLLCVFLANKYLFLKRRSDLFLWIILACIPLMSVTRMVITATLLSFPLSFSPMSIVRRIIFTLLIIMTGIAIFNLPAVQEKMFFSGHGDLSQVGRSSDFATSGRFGMWNVLYTEAKNNFLLGHGTGAAETITYSFTSVGYPHNDWLLTFFDYGITGVAILSYGIFFTIRQGLMAKNESRSKEIRLLFLTATSAFIPLMIVMFTDNILVYASFFGMMHYLILGFGYASLQTERDARKKALR